MNIPLTGPWLTGVETDAVMHAVKWGWYDHAYDEVIAFEKQFAAYVGRKYGIATPSCTTALHLALAAKDVYRLDGVIVPDLTWIATAAPVVYQGAIPQFADVEPLTWCISARTVEPRITANTVGVIAVGLYGGMADMEELEALCKAKGLFLIEDAAESLGSSYNGRPSGSFGDCSVFSFHGSKTITTGEGGMLVTDDQQLYETALSLRDHGRDITTRDYVSHRVGFKYRMSNMQAALGRAQLSRIDEILAAKRQVFEWYRQRLPDYQLNPSLPPVVNSYWLVSAAWPEGAGDVGHVVREMRRRGMDARPFFTPLSRQPATQTWGWWPTPHSISLSGRGINLPSAPRMLEVHVDMVAGVLRELVPCFSLY